MGKGSSEKLTVDSLSYTNAKKKGHPPLTLKFDFVT